ncbi:MAG: hypothetical protein R3D62_12715 [Xanthobacteraceae bacterium]
MSGFGDAFAAGRRRAGLEPGAQEKSDPFQVGVSWVETVFVPCVKQADQELREHAVGVRHDLNLNRSSTNHPHADFWFVRTASASGQSYDGPKYSFNVIDRDIMLYKPGASGRSLGSVDNFGAEQMNALLRDAAEEYGTMFRQE